MLFGQHGGRHQNCRLKAVVDDFKGRPHGQFGFSITHRRLLGDSFKECGLRCVTDGELVAAGKLKTRSTIDHVCLDEAWATGVVEVGAWEAACYDGKCISDHNGVYVDIASTG